MLAVRQERLRDRIADLARRMLGHTPMLESMWSRSTVVWVALGAACGGGGPPRLEPRPLGQRTFQAQTACGQRLLDTSFVASGQRWGERLSVVACGYRGVTGRVEVDVTPADGGASRVETWVGSGADDQRCRASDAELARATASGTGAGTDGGAPSAAAAPAATAGPTATRPAFREIDWSGEVCGDGDVTALDLGRLTPGSTIRVRIWTERPTDLEGGWFRLIHVGLTPTVSDRQWTAHLEAEERRRAAERERERRAAEAEPLRPIDLSWTADASPAVEARVRIPPPDGPPPEARAERTPPQPSVHAEWLPGSWHWIGTRWLWLAGHWRVPAADVTAGQTQRAPRPPPPARAETAEPALTIDVVWIPGYWAWDGAAYVWVAGGQRRVPRRGATWQAPSWRTRGGGVIFVPGGWRR